MKQIFGHQETFCIATTIRTNIQFLRIYLGFLQVIQRRSVPFLQISPSFNWPRPIVDVMVQGQKRGRGCEPQAGKVS